jgi:leucyl/phenylalanyl-tRNA--protein transferase
MTSSPVIWLPDDFTGPFPDPKLACLEPDGLLAAGGNLHSDTLLQAYSQGIFPWYSKGQPILWWSPDPRCVLFPQQFHVSRSFRRTLNKSPFTIRMNTAFRQVMLACAAPRNDQDGTWITAGMLEAYCTLHALRHAHSIECWHDDELVGGVYGVMLNDVFFGESMFSVMQDASKVALHHICTRMPIKLLDAQVHSPHLESLGASMIAREDFIRAIQSTG